MNYRVLVDAKLKELLDKTPDDTFGDVLYSIARTIDTSKVTSKNKLRDIEDKVFYTAICKAINLETSE